MAERITLQSILEAYEEDRLSKADFLEALEKVDKKLSDRMDGEKSELEAAAKSIAQAFDTLRDEIASERSRNVETIETTGMGLSERLEVKLRDLEGVIQARLDTLQDGEQGPQGEPGPQGPAGSPDTAEDIRNKLELLEGEERLKIEAIRGLREELDDLKKRAGQTTVVHSGGGGGAGKIVKSYDLSDSLDGSTATFALPAFYRVISVHLSSFPNILRPTTDYTTDGNAMTITFTAQIDPAVSLATGQSLIIVYSELI